jgi:hypothetical protein
MSRTISRRPTFASRCRPEPERGPHPERVGDSDWAEPRLFRWSAEPSRQELGRSLAGLCQLELSEDALDEGRPATDSGASGMRSAASKADGGNPGSATAGADRREARSGEASAVQISPTSIRIGGLEVVTTATDQDTLTDLLCDGRRRRALGQRSRELLGVR